MELEFPNYDSKNTYYSSLKANLSIIEKFNFFSSKKIAQ